MNATLAASSGLDEGGMLKAPVLAVPTRQSSQQISSKVDHAIQGVVSLVDDILTTVVDSHKGDEFDRCFPAYAQLVLAYSAIMRQTISPAVMQRVVWQSLIEEEELREKGLPAFGEAVTEQAIFTVWSMRKIGDVIEQIVAAPQLQSGNADDMEFCRKASYHALRARFSLDCLHFAIRHHRALSPDIIERIDDGMRSAVDSYSWIRQGLDLRLPRQESFEVKLDWDEEDQELLDASMSDVDGGKTII
ncbi:MAG: hypothetical protein WCD57_01920 [Acidobacteriaceae bacterium]